MANCKSCGEPVAWVTMQSGKKMPLDPLPQEDGNIEIVGATGRVVPRSEAERREGMLYRSHYASCPDASKHRRR